MSPSSETLDLIYGAIREINAQQPADNQLECRPDTVLLGASGALDSLGLINLLVLVEESVSERAGERVTLLDEQYMAAQDGPFSTVETLAAHIEAKASS